MIIERHKFPALSWYTVSMFGDRVEANVSVRPRLTSLDVNVRLFAAFFSVGWDHA